MPAANNMPKSLSWKHSLWLSLYAPCHIQCISSSLQLKYNYQWAHRQHIHSAVCTARDRIANDGLLVKFNSHHLVHAPIVRIIVAHPNQKLVLVELRKLTPLDWPVHCKCSVVLRQCELLEWQMFRPLRILFRSSTYSRLNFRIVLTFY